MMCPCCGGTASRTSITPDGVEACLMCRRAPWCRECRHCFDHCAHRRARLFTMVAGSLMDVRWLPPITLSVGAPDIGAEWAQGTAD